MRSAGPWSPRGEFARTGAPHACLVVLVFAAGCLVRVVNLGAPALSGDELYDVFAAKSVLAGEGFYLPSGRPYTRAWLEILLTALAFRLFGESEASARLPALAFGVVTLGSVYLAGRILFGPVAGLVALALTAFSSHAVDVARFARLYSPLTFFWLAAVMAAFRALDDRDDGHAPLDRRRLASIAAAVAAWAVAVHLHPVALALGVVVQAYAGIVAVAALARGRRRRAAALGAVAAAALAAEALVLGVPALREAVLGAARAPLPWYRPAPGDFLTYHGHLVGEYAWLWYLVWPATVLGVAAGRGAALFVALAFWLPFALVSGVVATKHPRYVVHLMPLAWLLLGAAAQALWPAVRDVLLRPLGGLAARPWVRYATVAVLLFAALAPLARFTPSVSAAVRRPWRPSGPLTVGYAADWQALARVVGPQIEPEARVYSKWPLAVRYYFGRPAHHVSALAPREVPDDVAQAVERVDRPAGYLNRLLGARPGAASGTGSPGRRADEASRPRGDFAALLAAGERFWVVAERSWWERRADPALRSAVEERCRRVPDASAIDFAAFACGDRAAEVGPGGGGGRRRAERSPLAGD